MSLDQLTKVELIRELRAVEQKLQATRTQDMWGPNRPKMTELAQRRQDLRDALTNRGYTP